LVSTSFRAVANALRRLEHSAFGSAFLEESLLTLDGKHAPAKKTIFRHLVFEIETRKCRFYATGSSIRVKFHNSTISIK
jgi:hypothetical protein